MWRPKGGLLNCSVLTIEVARCCWSYIAESKDSPRRAQYLLENIIIAGCIFGIASWPLFLSSPTGDLGAVCGPFALVCSSEDIVTVSWDVFFPCISYGEGTVVSDEFSLSCLLEITGSSLHVPQHLTLLPRQYESWDYILWRMTLRRATLIRGRLSLILAFEGMALPLGNVDSSKTWLKWISSSHPLGEMNLEQSHSDFKISINAASFYSWKVKRGRTSPIIFVRYDYLCTVYPSEAGFRNMFNIESKEKKSFNEVRAFIRT